MTPRGTLGLYCVHIAQLMTHPAIYTIPFTLELCYKPFGILQRVPKSRKVHTSNHDGLEKLYNINFVWHRSQVFPEREPNSRNHPLPQSSFLRTIDLLFFKQFFRSIILWLPFILHIKICRETWFPMIEVMEEVNQPQNWLYPHLLIDESGKIEYEEDRLKWAAFVAWVTYHKIQYNIEKIH